MTWNYVTPGIPDQQFERLPGIPLSPVEVRVLILAQLRLQGASILWDVGAGTGTIAVEAGLLMPQGQVLAIERDEEVVGLVERNCQKFQVKNVLVKAGAAPSCLHDLTPLPDRICVEGGQPLDRIILTAWEKLVPSGRLVVVASTLQDLYQTWHTFNQIPIKNLEAVQSGINRLEVRGKQQLFAATNPLFILSGEKPA
ncbi:MAG: precorrin-6Y C5,15-methyltransferase subunit CbiT [Pseudanabaenaceae cyanobacterium SKYGB_i_bin29]|nr:precorrin-6Y C5,15-methyltransferase subunit CbiT [Pseudanabaenaceae cyanobacterium SKYG29]MDW8421049.1 precorrin-6Y C5,15-methyltransferase subunit CbiT [Pseudanabaenaceae cyanobacterium SKYGB_i_bin29]